jgi:Rps23 Pro-64 3,4-dihydroxylase Tpa1-like proline 4-hydroxylase
MNPSDNVTNLAERFTTDDRILSSQEKELVTVLVQETTKLENTCSQAVKQVIARAVGEVVSRRAQRVLGESILSLLEGGPKYRFGTPPMTPPGPDDPNPPHPPGPNPPGIEIRAGIPPVTSPPVPRDPEPPHPPGPNPPGATPHRYSVERREAAVAVLETNSPEAPPRFLPANYVVLDEFLSPIELQALMQYALEKEMEFNISQVISPGVPGGTVDYETRRSRVLMELGPHREIIVNRLRKALPRVLTRLNHPEFEVTRVETQITASNDGDFFHWHNDNGEGEVATREITFVYFFHREPKPFGGGELRIYDSQFDRGMYRPTATYRSIKPEQNQAVLFASSLAHEITPVETPSRVFADSRFTVNGWFRR